VTDAGQDLGEGSARASRRRLPEWLVVIGVGVVGALVFIIPYLQNSIFYYVGDNPESFVPLWHHYGEQLRSGQWPTMDPSGWYGGNYAAETAYSLWNPVTLVNYLAVSLFDDLAAAAALVMIEFLALLSMATYLLAREYGAARVPSAVVAIAIPGTGFTLYYEAAGWPAGLMAFTWVAWFWWAARRHARGAMSPLVPFVFGVLAMTTGNPYATLGLVIVLVGIGVELLVRRDYRKLGHLAVMGACVGASLALVFLPLLGVMSVSSRQELAAIVNDTFMVPDLGDLAGSSAPTYLPSITNWAGAVRESLPSTYFIWFAIPLLPWLRWGTLRRAARPLTSVAVVSGLYALAVVGPSNLWLFRWPIRLIEYLYLGLGVLLAVLLSAGLARDRLRERALATGALVVFGGYLSFAVRPEYWRMHFAAMIAVLALVLGAVLAYRRWGWRAFGAVLLVGTIGVVTYQTSRIPVLEKGGIAVEPPRSVSRMENGTASYRGTVLQLASQTPVRTPDMDDGEILFGNETVAAGLSAINRYSGIGFAEFTSALCMDYKGSLTNCRDPNGAYDGLWRVVPGTGAPLIDALRVETLVLQDWLLPEVVTRTPPQGWRVEVRDGTRTVWIRENPLPHPGRVSFASGGTEVVSADAQTEHERVTFRAPEQGGRLVFARLAWPGYTATIDGQPVEVGNGEAGLITIAVPAGEHVLELDFRAPGLRLGAFILIGATGVVLVQSVLWWLAGRRGRRGRPAGTGPDPAGPEAADDTIPAVLTHAGSPADKT
jgi:hypothetical protein